MDGFVQNGKKSLGRALIPHERENLKMVKRNTDFMLPTASLEDLFSTQAERDDAKLERVKNIPLGELHPFKDHPFKIQNNEDAAHDRKHSQVGSHYPGACKAAS